MKEVQIRPWPIPIIDSQFWEIDPTSYAVDVLVIRRLPLPDVIKSWWLEDVIPKMTSFLNSPRGRIFWRYLEDISGSSVSLSELMSPFEVKNGNFALPTNFFVIPSKINWYDVKESGILSLSLGLCEATNDVSKPLDIPVTDVFRIGFKDPRGQLAALLSQSSGVVPIQSTLGFKTEDGLVFSPRL